MKNYALGNVIPMVAIFDLYRGTFSITMFMCSEGGVSGGARTQAELGWGMTPEAVTGFFFVVIYYLIYFDSCFFVKKI